MVGYPAQPLATWKTLDAAARELKVGRRTLTRWISEGKLKAYTIPGDNHRYVDMEEVRKFRQPRPIDQGKP